MEGLLYKWRRRRNVKMCMCFNDLFKTSIHSSSSSSSSKQLLQLGQKHALRLEDAHLAHLLHSAQTRLFGDALRSRGQWQNFIQEDNLHMTSAANEHNTTEMKDIHSSKATARVFFFMCLFSTQRSLKKAHLDPKKELWHMTVSPGENTFRTFSEFLMNSFFSLMEELRIYLFLICLSSLQQKRTPDRKPVNLYVGAIFLCSRDPRKTFRHAFGLGHTFWGLVVHE